MWTLRFITLAACLFMPAAAFACCTEADARDALKGGNFALAFDTAAPLESVDAKLIAAEALSAKVLLGTAEDGKDTAKSALEYAEAALRLDPKNAEALFQSALADGFITRATSPFTAWRKKLPQKTKETVDALLLATPDDARAHALLGAWHMGILRKAGQKNGEKWFGADYRAGVRAYETALSLRPDDIIISSNYALSLLEYDFAANNVRAKVMLETAVAAPPKDGVERAVQARMNEVLALWDDEKEVLKSAGAFLDGDG